MKVKIIFIIKVIQCAMSTRDNHLKFKWKHFLKKGCSLTLDKALKINDGE